jgi:chromosome segregation ATPase
MRVSELASKSTKLEKENKSLTEQLNLKDTKIKDLETKIENHTRLTESANAEKAKVNELTEKLAKVQAEAEETEKSLTEELAASKKKAQDRTNLAKSYKAKYDAVVERYIANKAKMLGVRSSDITSKLAESYSLDDIDNVCKDLINEGRPQFGLVGGNPRVRVNESVKSEKKVIDPDNGYEIDDDLLILAGLKD